MLFRSSEVLPVAELVARTRAEYQAAAEALRRVLPAGEHARWSPT